VVGVEHHPRNGAATGRDGRRQRVSGQLGAGVLGQGPADQPARVQIQHGGQVQEAVGDPQVGGVAAPALVWAGCGEVAAQQVEGGLGGRIAAGSATPATQVDPDDLVLAHQPLHPLVVDHHALGVQLGGDPWGPVGAGGVGVDLPDLLHQPIVLGGPGGPPVGPA
jgi:hypothetical protein